MLIQTFRMQKPIRYLIFVFFAPLLTFFTPMLLGLWFHIEWVPIIYAGIWNWEIVLGVFLSLLVGLELLFFFDMALYTATQKITLTQTGMGISAKTMGLIKFLNLLNKSMPIGFFPYIDISKIDTYGWFGILRIHLKTGKPVQVNVRQLENHEQFMVALTSKLSENQISEKAKLLGRPQQFLRWVQLLYFVCAFLFAMIGLGSITLIENPYKFVIWNHPVGAMSIHAHSFTFDKDGSIWAATYDDRGGFLAWHLQAASSKPQVWHLLSSPCTEGFCYVDIVSHTENGFPVLIFVQDETSILYTWDGNQWQKDSLDVAFFNPGKIFYGPIVWGESDNKLFRLDLSNNHLEEIPGPAFVALKSPKLSQYQVNQDGSVLAIFNVPDSGKILAVFNQGHWQKAIQAAYVTQAAVDFQGKIWAVSFSKDDSYQIGYYDNQKQAWNWSPLPENFNKVAYFSSLAIDSRGRIWLRGSEKTEYNYLDFLNVLEWRDGEVINLREYNEDNADNLMADKIAQSPDGHLWINTLHPAWIDGTGEKLPQPLPDWLFPSNEEKMMFPNSHFLLFMAFTGSTLALSFLTFWLESK